MLVVMRLGLSLLALAVISFRFLFIPPFAPADPGRGYLVICAEKSPRPNIIPRIPDVENGRPTGRLLAIELAHATAA